MEGSFSPVAEKDLKGIVQHIARDDAGMAARFGHALLNKAEQLGVAPKMGVRYERDGQARYIAFRSYLIIYDVDEVGREVVVHRFWHGARGFRPRV